MDLSTADKLKFEEIVGETNKALQIKFSPTEIHWIPKSQSRFIDLDNDKIYLPEWLIKEKGLEDFIVD